MTVNRSTLDIYGLAKPQSSFTQSLDSPYLECDKKTPQVTNKVPPASYLIQRVDALLKNLSEGLMIINENRVILHINAAAQHSLDLPEFSYNSSINGILRLRDKQLQQRLENYIDQASVQHAPFLQEPLHLCLRQWCGKGELFLKVVSMTFDENKLRSTVEAHVTSNTEFIVSINNQDYSKGFDLSQTAILFGLSLAEIAVLNLVIQGKSNKEIARKRSVCATTVKSQVKSLMTKTNSDNRTMLVHKALSSVSVI